MRHFLRLMFFGGLAVLVSSSARGGEYVQTNIVSDLTGVAPNVDPNLKNPWGMSFSGSSPFWVSNQVSGTSTLYNALGSPVKQDLTVTIPTTSSGPQGPTGQVSNSNTSAFLVDGSYAHFIFANLNGTISAWNPSAGTAAQLRSDNLRCRLHRPGHRDQLRQQLPLRRQRRRRHHGLRQELQRRDGNDLRRQVC